MAPTDMRLLALLVLAASLVVADPPSAMPHVVAARRGAAPGRATLASVDAPGDAPGSGRAEAIRRITALEPRAAPGVKFIYSDIGYIILEEVVARVSGRDLAKFSAESIFRPLGMTETGYLPPLELRRRAAPTEIRDGA